MSATEVIECRGLTLRVPGRVLLRDLDASFGRGRVIALLGRNGAGKSTLLHALAGLRAAESGEIRLRGRALGSWARRERAREIALLPQSAEDPFPGTVLETALVGRHPHLTFWQWEGDTDREIARRTLAEMDLAGLEERDVATLSGGERRRLAIASVLAQDPAVFLLDEPIQQLDPQHELGVLTRFRTLADAGRTVVMSLHDAGIAVRYADDAMLLGGDGNWTFGPCAQVLDEQSIERLYGVAVRELRWESGRTFVPVAEHESAWRLRP
jgi:iron complex transport system ATP-binding protein